MLLYTHRLSTNFWIIEDFLSCALLLFVHNSSFYEHPSPYVLFVHDFLILINGRVLIHAGYPQLLVCFSPKTRSFNTDATTQGPETKPT